MKTKKVWYDREMRRLYDNDKNISDAMSVFSVLFLIGSFLFYCSSDMMTAFLFQSMMILCLALNVYVQIRMQRRVQTDYIERGFRKILWKRQEVKRL